MSGTEGLIELFAVFWFIAALMTARHIVQTKDWPPLTAALNAMAWPYYWLTE